MALNRGDAFETDFPLSEPVAPDWNGYFPEWASREPVPLMTQLVVLHAARPASFAGGLGFKFSANADSKPPTHSAAMAQQIRLSAPRNISSLKLCQTPCLNILVLFAIVTASRLLTRGAETAAPGVSSRKAQQRLVGCYLFNIATFGRL